MNRNRSDQPRKWVWRISEQAPMGEWVDPTAPVHTTPRSSDLPEVASGGWIVSSFDLLRGTDVDQGHDTVPAELFDELFPGASKSA